MEETISAQGADISRLHRIINQKDKEIHSLKKRLSKYEEPGKDSHNSSVPPFSRINSGQGCSSYTVFVQEV